MDTERRGWWVGPLGMAVGSGLLLGGCLGLMGGGKGEPTAFANVDKDGDAAVTATEFAQWGKDQGVLDAFMGEAKGEIANTALTQGIYDIWDIEGSGITEAEWNEGLKSWFPDAEAQDYTSWDLSQDGSLDRDELVAGFAHSGILNTWDDNGDTKLDTNEAYGRFYDVFDRDGDGALTTAEWTGGLASWNWDF